MGATRKEKNLAPDGSKFVLLKVSQYKGRQLLQLSIHTPLEFHCSFSVLVVHRIAV